MGQVATALEVSRSFDLYGRQALKGPVTITEGGHDSLVLISHAEYERLKRRDREVLTLADFTDEDRALVAAARAPEAAKAFNHEMPPGE